MDTLYYSNYCKHCQKILQYIVKSNLIDKINAICIDKRKTDPRTGQYIIVLETGKTILLPPNVHSVPSLLVKSNYHVISGDEIIQYFEPVASLQEKIAHGSLGEPSGFDLTSNSLSDPYTFYSEPSGQKALQSQRDSFVSANHSMIPIHAEPDNYRPNKLSADVTIDQLHSYRTEDIKKLNNEEMNAMISEMTETREQDKQHISSNYTMAPKI